MDILSLNDPGLRTPLPFRRLYETGALLQRDFVRPTGTHGLEAVVRQRGLGVRTGREVWEHLDEIGAFSPVAFATHGYSPGADLGGPDIETMVFRDERGFVPWDEFAFADDVTTSVAPLYSPWQALYLPDVLRGREVNLPVEDLLHGSQRERWFSPNGQALLAQRRDRWATLDERWRATTKLLVRLQNRFWPFVSGRVVLPWDHAAQGRVDPLAREIEHFDAGAVLAELELTANDVARAYEFLQTLAARRGPGDGWCRLRTLAPRAARQRFSGPARMEADLLEAGLVLRRFWHELTGDYLPDCDEVARRRTTSPITDDACRDGTFARDRDALKEALVSSGMYPHSVHVIVEGDSEELLVRELLAYFLGGVPGEERLVLTNLQGVGAAKRVETLVDMIAAYATSSVLIVDSEGDMKKYVEALLADGTLNPDDVLMFDKDLEESTWSDDEIVDLAKRLAAAPPPDAQGRQRPAVELRLTGDELRAEHDRKVAAAPDPANPPGLANTLVGMARRDDRGAALFTKPELSRQALEQLKQELDEAHAAGREAFEDAVERRRLLSLVYWRIAQPLASNPLR